MQVFGFRNPSIQARLELLDSQADRLQFMEEPAPERDPQVITIVITGRR